MAEYPDILNIPSAEAEAVSRILQPAQAPERQYHGSPYAQSYADYSQRLNSTEDARIQQESNLAIQSEIQRRIALPTMGGQRARTLAWQQAMEKAIYEKQARALLDDLNKLDPADPEALSQQDEIFAKHPISRDALKDPRVSNVVKRQATENEELQSLFDKDVDARQEYADLRASGIAPMEARRKVKDSARTRAEKIAYAMQGGNPDDFEKFVDPTTGRLDKSRLAFNLAERKRAQDALLSSTERKALETAAESVTPPDVSDAGKVSAFKSQFRREPVTEEDWNLAYSLAERGQGTEALKSLIDDLERAGKSVPDLYRKMIVPQNSPAVSGSAQVAPSEVGKVGSNAQQSSVPQVLTQAQYSALPSGALYKGKDGVTRQKK